MTPDQVAGPESDAWLGEELRRGAPVPEAPSRWVASFPALVLLVTFTLGVGVAASFLAPGINGLPSNPFGGGGTHGTNNTTPLPLNITNPPPTKVDRNGSRIPNPDNNTTGSHPGGNGTGPNGTGPTKGNSTGNGTTKSGPCSVDCSQGNNTNNSSGPPRIVNPPVKRVALDRLPWFVWQPQLLIAVSAFVAIGSLFALVAFDAVRPPPPSPTDPWRFQRRREHRRGPTVSPEEAVGAAARRLEAALAIGYTIPREELRGHIFALYAALLDALGPALGELSARTPREVEWLSVRYLGVSPETARWLTGLFEEARYSSHPIRPESIGAARDALLRLLQELQRFVGR
jgi:hypothetical protein